MTSRTDDQEGYRPSMAMQICCCHCGGQLVVETEVARATRPLPIVARGFKQPIGEDGQRLPESAAPSPESPFPNQ